MSKAEELLALAARVEAAEGADRGLADRVLLAAGWKLNHDRETIEGWFVDPGTCEGEDGENYPVTLADRMAWACWYAPGDRPFRDKWIDGHYRPDPLASLDAALLLVPAGMGFHLDRYWMMGRDGPAWLSEISSGGTPSDPRQVHGAIDAYSAATAVTAAALRAIAHQEPKP